MNMAFFITIPHLMRKDTVGHPVGNEVHRTLIGCLQHIVRELLRPMVDEVLVDAPDLLDVGGKHPDIMGHQNDGCRFIELQKEFVDALLHPLVDACRGFVEQDELRFGAQCPGNQDPLLLSTGEGGELTIPELIHLNSPEGIQGSIPVLPGKERSPAQLSKSSHEHHIPDRDRELSVIVDILGDIADHPPCLHRTLPEDCDRSTGGPKDPEDHFQEGGLPPAVRTDDPKELVLLNCQVHIFQDVMPIVSCPDIVQFQGEWCFISFHGRFLFPSHSCLPDFAL